MRGLAAAIRANEPPTHVPISPLLVASMAGWSINQSYANAMFSMSSGSRRRSRIVGDQYGVDLNQEGHRLGRSADRPCGTGQDMSQAMHKHLCTPYSLPVRSSTRPRNLWEEEEDSPCTEGQHQDHPNRHGPWPLPDP